MNMIENVSNHNQRPCWSFTPGGAKKRPRKSRKTPMSLVCGHDFFPEENLGKNEVKLHLVASIHFVHRLYSTWFCFGCRFVVSPISLCMVSCKYKICMIIAYLLSSTQMFQ